MKPFTFNNFPDVPYKKINDKLESDRFILSSGMNYTPFKIVYNLEDTAAYLYGPLEEVTLEKDLPIGPFSIRFKGKGMQPFVPNLSRSECFAYCTTHFQKKDVVPLGIYESSEHYDQYRQFNGEIWLHWDGTLDAIYNPKSQLLKMRDALKSPDVINVVGVSWDYKPLRPYVDYLCKFGVVGPVVELTAFSHPVGVKNENIVIWECRDF